MGVDIKRILGKVDNLEKTLNDLFAGRSKEVEAVIVALLTGEPALFIGPPGTAKTALVETTAKLIEGARYFYYLMTRYTTPEELLGPYDVQAYRKGELRRVTRNKLPDADVVFLDEVFKSSAASRSLLLDIMVNKRFYDGTEIKPVKWLAFFGASNEVIIEDEADRAFFDRFTVRVYVDYVDPEHIADLLKKGVVLPRKMKSLTPVIKKSEIKAVQDFIEEYAEIFVEKYMEILRNVIYIAKSHIKREISDRRKVKFVKVAAALHLYQGSVNDAVIKAVRLVFGGLNKEEEEKIVEELTKKTGSINDFVKMLETVEKLLSRKDSLTIKDLEKLLSLYGELKEIWDELPQDVKECFRNKMEKVSEEIEEIKRLVEEP